MFAKRVINPNLFHHRYLHSGENVARVGLFSKQHKIERNILTDFSTLPDHKKEPYIRDLYTVYQATSYGRDFHTFQSRFYDTAHTALHVHVMKDFQDKTVGYSIIRRFMMHYPQCESSDTQRRNTFAIFRTSVAILPEYQGQGTMRMGRRALINQYYQDNPDVNIVAFNVILNPIVFDATLKECALTFPSPTLTTPPKVLDFMCYLRKYYGYELSHTSPYGVKETNVIKLSQEIRETFRNDSRPSTKLYTSITDMAPGNGMIFLSIYNAVPGNPLEIAPTTSWSYDKYPIQFDIEETPHQSLLNVIKSYPKVRPAYFHEGERSINPAYQTIENCERLPINEKRIWVLRGDFRLALGIKNILVEYGNTSLFKKIDSTRHQHIDLRDRYGHTSLAMPEQGYDGSAYLAGWLAQRENNTVEILLHSGRYQNTKLSLKQRMVLEKYIALELGKTWGQQSIVFIDYQENYVKAFVGNKPLRGNDSRIYVPTFHNTAEMLSNPVEKILHVSTEDAYSAEYSNSRL